MCPDISAHRVVADLNSSVDAESPQDEAILYTVEYNVQMFCTNRRIDRFKQPLQYLIPPTSSVTDILDTCLPADYILLLLSATVEVPESSLNVLRSILSQGTPSVIPIVANVTAQHNPKTRTEVKKSLLTYVRQFIPTVDRVFAADDRGEASTVMRMLCTGVPTGIRWREQRSYILPEGWRWDENEGVVVLYGTIRGKPLQADRLVHLPAYGDYQIDKVSGYSFSTDFQICSLPDVFQSKSEVSMDVDGNTSSMDAIPDATILASPTSDQDTLSPLADEDAEMADDNKSIHSHKPQSRKGVRIDDHYYFEDDEPEQVKKNLAKGSNDYQAAWYINDHNESESDEDEDEIEMDEAFDDESETSYREEEQSDIDEAVSEMDVDLSPEEERRQ